MSRRPAYLKSKSGSYWLVSALLAVLVWLIYGYGNDFPLQSLVEHSILKERHFQGQTEELFVPEAGLKTYYMYEDSSPLVAMSFLFDKSGTAYDPEAEQGTAVLTAMTLKDGAGKFEAEELREEMAVRGIQIGFGADKDVFSGYMITPKEFLPQATEYLRLILTQPRFERIYFDNAKERVLKTLATEKEDPDKELSLAFNRRIYGNHPYGRNPLGTATTIENIKRSDLQAFVRKKLGRDNLYIGIAGDLTKEEAVVMVKDIFKDLREESESVILPEPHIDWQQPVLHISRNGGQNIAAFAAQGTCRKCADFYPLYIANYLFGGAGLNSRLNQRIREKEGLTYGGYSGLVINDLSDLLTAGFSATAKKFGRAETLFEKEWKKVGQRGFSSEELASAQNYLTASYNLRFASVAGIAEMLAYMQKYDLGLDFLRKRNSYVKAVTLEQLNAAAKKYFNESLLQAEIGNFGGEKN